MNLESNYIRYHHQIEFLKFQYMILIKVCQKILSEDMPLIYKFCLFAMFQTVFFRFDKMANRILSNRDYQF